MSKEDERLKPITSSLIGPQTPEEVYRWLKENDHWPPVKGIPHDFIENIGDGLKFKEAVRAKKLVWCEPTPIKNSERGAFLVRAETPFGAIIIQGNYYMNNGAYVVLAVPWIDKDLSRRFDALYEAQNFCIEELNKALNELIE